MVVNIQPSYKKISSYPQELLALNRWFSDPIKNHWNEVITCQYYKYILEIDDLS